MQQKDWLVMGAIVVVGFVAVLGLSKPTAVIDSTKVDVKAIADHVLRVVSENLPLGATPGPEDLNPYHCANGVCEYSYSTKVKSATSTVCSFKSPAASTTVQKTPRVQFRTVAGFTTTWLWGYSSTQNATSTSLGSTSTLSAPAFSATILASSTNDTIPPNTYFSLNLSTSTDGVNANFAPAGSCEMSLIVL